jgi:hypothetical protein
VQDLEPGGTEEQVHEPRGIRPGAAGYFPCALYKTICVIRS